MDQTGTKKIGVQHHHAHIVSCMTEHGLEGPVIGLAFDGTGYGTDGRIWGGEILWTQSDRFTRLAHLDYVPMPGGSAAIKEPWRMALSYLNDAFGEAIWGLGLPLFETVEKRKIKTILEMIKKGVNCPETSSLGRLFDGVAALLDICYVSSYEGQAAIELEMAIEGEERNDTYPYEWQKGEEIYHVLPAPIIRGVTKDILEGKSTSSISHKFHITLIRLFSDLCVLLGESTGVDRIVLSGGVFQNALLLTHMEKALKARGLQVFSHSLIPSNDGGISLGQAAIAAAISRSKEE
jgi:hydrogenase maturation protein HypF